MFSLLKRLGKYWWILGLCVLFVIGQVMCDLLLPVILGEIIASLSDTTKTVADIMLKALYLLGVSALSGVCGIVVCKFATMTTSHLIAVTRYELYKKVGTFSTTEMNQFSVSSLVTRTTNDLTFVSNTFNLMFRFVLYGPLISICAMLYLISRKVWPMTITVLVAVVVLLVFIIVLVKIAIPKYRSIQKKLDKVTLVSREHLEGLRVIRAYNAEDFQEEKFAAVNQDLAKTTSFSNKALGLLMPGIQLIIGLLQVAIYLVASNLMNVPNPTFKYADISVVIQFASLILVGFVLIVVLVVQLPRAIVCAARVNEVLNSEIAVKDAENPVTPTEVGTIEFKDVSFGYPGADEPVLQHISFSCKKGETIAFIGATGAGKTTLVNLLPRFFDCDSGEVLVDGVNVKDYKLSDLFDKFGYVPQKGYLFHDTLLNNIILGKPNASAIQVKRALEISQSADFVSNLPGKTDYEISQGGKNVSGGQRQRLCIARAILMEPEFFIFDDSFSALDYKTDKVLRGEIKKQCAGTTNVIVAQRVGTIIDADQIIVLDAGKMVGKGTHQELLKNCPIYKEIALSQLSEEELGLKESKKGGK